MILEGDSQNPPECFTDSFLIFAFLGQPSYIKHVTMRTTQRCSFVRMTCTNVKERLSRPQVFAFRDITLKSTKQAAYCPAANLEISMLEWGLSERTMWFQEVAMNVRLVLRKEGSLTASCYFTRARIFTSYALPHLFFFFFSDIPGRIST